MKREVNMRSREGQKFNFEKEKKTNESSKERIITDPFGSWTGIPTDDPYEQPIQDVDDL